MFRLCMVYFRCAVGLGQWDFGRPGNFLAMKHRVGRGLTGAPCGKRVGDALVLA